MAQDDKLVVEVGLDSSALSRGLDAVRRKAKQTWGDVGKSTLRYAKALKDIEVVGGASMRKLVKERKRLDAATNQSIAQLRDEAAEFRRAYDNHSKIIRDLRDEYKGASEERRREIKKDIAADKARQKALLSDFKKRPGQGPSEKGANGMGTTMANAVGGMVKGLGGVMKSLGPILGAFSKFAPLIGAVTGGLTGIVQLLIDAEAGAKEMNKNLLQASGTGATFYRNLGRGDTALASMKGTLKDIRDQATSLDNVSWGINKDDHMAVLNTLSQEGIALDTLSDSFAASKGHAKSFAGTVQVAVAYSRQFGVSLGEISQFQGEMMTELGSSLTTVETQFSMMSRSAAESGIAQNKFFSIIRGVSSDLNLYNSRLEDSVKILGQLGKVMNPRNAQKFMSGFMQGFKGKGRTDLVKMNLLAGGKGAEYNKRDINRKAGDIGKQLGVSANDVLDETKTMSDLLSNVPKEQQGAMKEAIFELRQDSKMNKKGLFGSSMAMSNLSPGAALQMTQDAISRFGGGKKKLSDMAGDIGPEMMAEQLGISREELSARMKMEAAFDDQREELKRGFQRQDPATLEKLARAGIDGNKIDSIGYDQLMDTMDKSQQEELKNSSQAIDYNKKTSEFTSTISDKIGQLVDFIMNQLYNVMTGIWDVILDIAAKFGAGDAKARDKAKLEASVNKSRNKELMDLAVNSKDSADFRGKALQSGTVKQMRANMMGTDRNDEIAEMRKQQANSNDPQEVVRLGKAIAAAEADQKGRRDAAFASVNKNVQLDGTGATKAMYDALVDPTKGADARWREKSKSASDKVSNGSTLDQAMRDSGFTEVEISKAMERVFLNQMGGDNFGANMSAFGGILGGAGVKPGAPGAATPTQPGTTPVGTPGGVPSGGAPAVAAAAKVEPPMTQEQGSDMLSTTDAVQRTLEQKGIKINQSFLRDKFWSNGHDAVLDAMREALFEYFMYSGMDKTAVAQGLKDGTFTANNFGKGVVSKATGTGTVSVPSPPGGANGGVVMKPRSPDSVFAAVQPGETILPRGAGGQGGVTIPITVNGPGGQELANMMQSAAIDVVQQWQRKQRFQ